jgi:hypothetical protein
MKRCFVNIKLIVWNLHANEISMFLLSSGSLQPADVKAFTAEAKQNLVAKTSAKSSLSLFSRAVTEICEAEQEVKHYEKTKNQGTIEQQVNNAKSESVVAEGHKKAKENGTGELVKEEPTERNVDEHMQMDSNVGEHDKKRRKVVSHVGSLEITNSMASTMSELSHEPGLHKQHEGFDGPERATEEPRFSKKRKYVKKLKSAKPGNDKSSKKHLLGAHATAKFRRRKRAQTALDNQTQSNYNEVCVLWLS